MQPLAVLFFGPQGAGKGTQVDLLIKYLREKDPERRIIHLDMGKELRSLRDTGTHTGKLVGEIIDNGIRIADFMPIYLQTKMFIEEYSGSEHVIADGVARGPDQTQAFEDMMKFYKHENFHVIDIVISDDVAVTRLLARGRNDDTEDAIRSRLAWTKRDVLPQLELLRDSGRPIHQVNGEASVEEVHADILQKLGLS